MYKLILISLLGLLVFGTKAQEDIVYTINEGQWGAKAHFVANTSSSTIILRSSEIVFGLVDGAAMHAAIGSDDVGSMELVESAHWSIVFEGANLVEPIGEDTVPTVYHYYLGNDRSKWRSNVNGVNRVRYCNLYDHIDLLVYGKKGNFKYDFIVHPGGDPSDIRWSYRGVDPHLNEHSELEFELPWTTIVELAPFSYQLEGSRVKEVASEISKSRDGFGFVCADYDREKKLILDPEIVFATYGAAGQWCDNVIPHEGGDLVTNSVLATIAGVGNGIDSVFSEFGGHNAIRLSQLTNDGSILEWAAMIGGDGAGLPYTTTSNSTSIVVSARTYGEDFPVSENAFQATQIDWGGFDEIMFALSADGSSFLGGTHLNWWSDAFGRGTTLALESENDYNYESIGSLVRLSVFDSTVYFAATCKGIPQFDGIPTQLFGFPDDTVGVDVVVGSMPMSMNTVNWFTVLGADPDTTYAWGHEGINDLKILPNGELGICGWSRQMHFPVSEGAADGDFEGDQEAWIAKLDKNTGDLLASTYFGNESREEAWILHPMDNKIAVIGRTDHTSEYNGSVVLWGESSVWIGVFDNALTDLELLYTLGSQDSHEEVTPVALGSDACGNLIFSLEKSQWQDSSGSSLQGWPLSLDAFQSDVGRYYMGKLNVRTNEIDFGTYYGGTFTHRNQNYILDGGIMHHGSCVEGNDAAGLIATTVGVFNESDVTFPCCEPSVSVLDFTTTQEGEVQSSVDYTIVGACAPYELQLDQLWEGGQVSWDFGDGTSGEGHTLEHVYDSSGVYTIAVSLVDSTTCNIESEEIIIIELETDSSDLAGYMDLLSGGLCEMPQQVTASFVGVGADNYQWQVDDEIINTEEGELEIGIEQGGSYIISLIVEDEFCEKSIQYSDTLHLFNPLELDWDLDGFQASLCSDLEFRGTAEAANYTWFHWVDNLGQESSEEEFLAIYPQGEYEVMLTAYSEPCDSTAQLTTTLIVGVDESQMPQLQYPNVFTPEGDGLNEGYRLMNDLSSLSELSSYSLTIINKWGSVLWQSTLAGESWDGRINGQEAPEGTYYYISEYSYRCLADEIETQKGSFTLLR